MLRGAAGADAILLIAAALDAAELADFAALTSELGMSALVEVHNAAELDKVMSVIDFAPASRRLLGVNNRDLTTFTVDIATTINLIAGLPPEIPVVSESVSSAPGAASSSRPVFGFRQRQPSSGAWGQ